jgi:hypothetical protein
MTQTVLERLNPTNRVLKRAQYEAFAFSLYDGDVLVRNESHLNPADHEYRVTVVDGIPKTCECPADKRFEGPCKHRTAIAIRPPILDVATQMQLVADGGVTTEKTPIDPEDDTEVQKCDCQYLNDDFPCWDCVKTGRRELPE